MDGRTDGRVPARSARPGVLPSVSQSIYRSPSAGASGPVRPSVGLAVARSAPSIACCWLGRVGPIPSVIATICNRRADGTKRRSTDLVIHEQTGSDRTQADKYVGEGNGSEPDRTRTERKTSGNSFVRTYVRPTDGRTVGPTGRTRLRRALFLSCVRVTFFFNVWCCLR